VADGLDELGLGQAVVLGQLKLVAELASVAEMVSAATVTGSGRPGSELRGRA
jgi:hypothetical protein